MSQCLLWLIVGVLPSTDDDAMAGLTLQPFPLNMLACLRLRTHHNGYPPDVIRAIRLIFVSNV